MALVRGPEDIKKQSDVGALLWHALNHVQDCTHAKHYTPEKLEEAMFTLCHLIDLVCTNERPKGFEAGLLQRMIDDNFKVEDVRA